MSARVQLLAWYLLIATGILLLLSNIRSIGNIIVYLKDTGALVLLPAERMKPHTMAILPAMAWSLVRVVVGVIGGALVGLAAGILVHRLLIIRSRLLLLVTCLAAISPVIWAQILFRALHGGDIVCISLVMLTTSLLLTLATAYGLQGMPREYLIIARSHALTGLRRVLKVELPYILPAATVFVRLALLLGWGTVVLAEGYGLRHGLGQLILLGYNLSNAPIIAAGVVLTVSLALALDGLMAVVANNQWRRVAELGDG